MSLQTIFLIVVFLSLQNPPSPLSYPCIRARGPLNVDGILNEKAWEDAPWSPLFVDIRGETSPSPRLETRMKMMWDDRSLFIGARLREPDLWATISTRDSVIYLDNDFEVFLDPDGDGKKYVELEINALGTVWDLLLTKPYREGGRALTNWNIQGLLAAVSTEGTLNDPADRDSGWTVELAIPWSALDTLGVMALPPKAGDVWRMNFSRVEWKLERADGRYVKPPQKEDNWVWSPQRAVNMHIPDRWGRVKFVTSAAPAR